MKTLFIEARAKTEVVLPDELIEFLPDNIILATTVQYLSSINNIKQQLELKSKTVELYKIKCGKYPGQMLGCDPLYKQDPEGSAFLFVGDGLFHPKAFLMKNKQEVFIFNPFSQEFRKLGEEDIIIMKRRHKGALLKFLDSKTIGVLISTKSGQGLVNQDNILKEIEKKYPDKIFYKFIGNTIDFNDLENFPFIDSWVNTACPRIAYDEMEKLLKPILNLIDLVEL